MKDRDKYRNDSLSEEEKDKLYGPLIRAKARNDLRDRWSNKLADQHNVHRQENTTVPGRSRRINLLMIIATAAAAIAFLLIARPFGDKRTPDALALSKQYLEADPFPSTISRKSSVEEENEQIRQQMASAYSRRQYEQAIRLGEQLKSRTETDTWDNFYLSLSYLYNDQASVAITSLLETRDQSLAGNHEFEQEIRWFLALAYLQNQQELLARELLVQIRSGDWKYQEARQLLALLP